MHRVFKIATVSEWAAALAGGSYAGSSDDRRDGFIHLSAACQIGGTLAKHFPARHDLVLIAFDAKNLSPNLVWETSRGGKLFPHYYGALSTALALWHRPIPAGSSGNAEVPAEWLDC